MMQTFQLKLKFFYQLKMLLLDFKLVLREVLNFVSQGCLGFHCRIGFGCALQYRDPTVLPVVHPAFY